MGDENDCLKLLEGSTIEKLTSDMQSQCYEVDMLRMQLACFTTNGSAGDDRSSNLLENMSDATRQEVNFSELATAHEVTEGEFDSTELPSPPTDSPELTDQGEVCDPVSAVSSDVVDSISSRTSRDSYLWSSADSDLPSWFLDDDEEKLIWPLKEEFSVTDKFEENNQYTISTEIGDGAFGKCYTAYAHGGLFCVKKCQYRYYELLALRLARKEHIAEIITFYGAKIKGKDAYIFMELMEGGTIAELIQEKKRSRNGHWPIMSETDSLGFLEDVLKAVKFVHSKGIVHKDIKGDNVLLDVSRLRAKLTDFGSAQSVKEKDARPSADILRIAYLLLEMLNGERRLLLINEEIENYIPSGAMEVTKELLRSCFGLKTADQNYLIPSAAEILKSSDAFPVTELLKRLSNPSREQLPGSENSS